MNNFSILKDQKILFPILFLIFSNVFFYIISGDNLELEFAQKVFFFETVLTIFLLLISAFYAKKTDQLGFIFLVTFTIKNILVYLFYSLTITEQTKTISNKLYFTIIFLSFMCLDAYFTAVLLQKNSKK
ncbi:hypothetical protein SAMN05444337_0804 [Flavobacterium haoranii]|uniref:Uncharacterized protein n=1 Tax=Flavobacterium haoranii TaxID=683124 RepID=A0A1M6E0R5_9FLAO|nr:hypothetical protein SAMN05444337_0804 [Flavobacterium haoranii]